MAFLSARERIRQVVEKWFITEPLLFAVWTTHDLVMEPRIHSIRVRRGRIEYNPEFIEALYPRELSAVLRCEAVRILLKHPYARRKENAQLAYLASNLTLQEYLQTELPMPRARDLFGTDAFDRQYFEFYYYKLQEQADHAAGSGSSPQAASMPSAAGGGAGAPGDANTSQGQTGSWQPEEPTSPNQPQAGSSTPEEDEPSPLEEYTDPAVSGRENTEEWDADEFLTDRINEQIRTAQENNRWGTIAGNLRERVLATLKPKVDYRAVLRQFRKSIVSVRRVLTRMKPSRRYGFLYMGSRYDFATRLLFAVDVSGSIGSEDLQRGFSIINRFFKYGVPAIDVVQFDTELKGEPYTLKHARSTVDIIGRGGTSFAPIVQYIEEHPEYDGLIIFTDGIAPAPPKPQNRRTRILWLFNNESTYTRMWPNLRHIGQAVFLKAD